MKKKGYTLLELVIVITISIILFASTAVVIGDQIEGNKIRSTGIKIEALTQALENYLPLPFGSTSIHQSSHRQYRSLQYKVDMELPCCIHFSQDIAVETS